MHVNQVKLAYLYSRGSSVIAHQCSLAKTITGMENANFVAVYVPISESWRAIQKLLQVVLLYFLNGLDGVGERRSDE